MGNQYAVFHSYFRQILTGGASPFFSWRVDLGMNFLPVLGYYLASPFSLLVLFFPDQYIPEAMVLIMLLKIGTGGACMAALLRRISDAPKPVAAVFGATYAVGAWSVAYGFNVMWLDILYLLPLALLAVEHLLDTDRVFRLAVVFAACFLINFYDAALLLPFVALYLIARKVGADGGVRVRRLGALCLRAGMALAIGVAVSGILLFPVLMGIVHGRTAILGTDMPPVPVPWSGVEGRLFGGTMDWAQYSPNFASTSAVLVVASLFPFVRSIPRHERLVFVGIALLLVLGSQNLDVYLFWHAAEKPNGFPYRYAFMMPAVLSIMACRAWSGLRGRRATVLVIRSAAFWLGVLTVCAALQGWLVSTAVWVCAGLAVVAAGLLFALIAWRGAAGRMLTGAVAAVVLVDATVSAVLEAEHIPYPYRSVWSANPASSWDTAMRSTAPRSAGFHRTGSVWSNFDNGYRLSHNDSLRTGAYGLNHFSSMSSGQLHEALTDLGFTHYQSLVWVSDTGSTVVTDAFLDNADLVAPAPLRRMAATELRAWPGGSAEGGKPEPDRPATVASYRNDAVLPGGFVADFTPAVDLPHSDPFLAQEDLLGTHGLFQRPCAELPSVTGGTLTPYQNAADGSPQIRVVKNDPHHPVAVTWNCRSLGESQVYGWTDTLVWGGMFPGKGAFHVRLDDGPSADYPTVYDNGIHDFGAVPAGRFTVTLTTKADSFALPASFVRSVDAVALRSRIGQLSRTELHDVAVSDTSFTATADSPRGGIAVVAVPYIFGWTAEVDGHERQIQRVDGSFIGLRVGPGEHHIALRFQPPGLRLGSVATALGLLALAAVFLWERRRGRFGEPATIVIPAPSAPVEQIEVSAK